MAEEPALLARESAAKAPVNGAIRRRCAPP